MAEVKATREVFAVAIATTDELDILLQKFTYWKTMKICAWMMRFVHNVRSKTIGRLKGPLTTEETNKAKIFWVKRVQMRATADKHYQEDRLQLSTTKPRRHIGMSRENSRAFSGVFAP